MAKGKSTKQVNDDPLWQDEDWRVFQGKLTPGRGRPRKEVRLFRAVAEKLPYNCLKDLRNHILTEVADINEKVEGVYLAHDSMGFARYGGRGQIFSRLAEHKNNYPLQLMYFSFYIVASKIHEREIETVILRAAGPQMTLNERKVARNIEPGNIQDYEPGTIFFERRPC